MRIITGLYKGRHFDVPHTFKARPTTDFAKENIFNVLTQYVELEGATALDLFAGTGSITLELLSRGCAQVISVEQDRDHHRFICDCLKKIGVNTTPGRNPVDGTQTCLPLRADAFRFLKSCRQQFDFVFADPPYALKELTDIPGLVMERGILKTGGIFVFEHGKNNDFSSHPHFVEHRAYGSVNFSIFRVTPPNPL